MMNSTLSFSGRSVDPHATATRIRDTFPNDLHALRSMIAHPRSLARPIPTWRPPTQSLPPIAVDTAVSVTVARHRIGPTVRRRLRILGEHREAAYLISARFTAPTGHRVSSTIAESWIRALIPADAIECVHEIDTELSPTFVWVVASDYSPIHSPVSLFKNTERAA